MIIRWNDDATAVSDADAMDFIRKEIDSGTNIIDVSTITMLYAARVLHKRGELEIDHVMFGDNIALVDKDGRLSRWPSSGCDIFDKYLDELA